MPPGRDSDFYKWAFLQIPKELSEHFRKIKQNRQIFSLLKLKQHRPTRISPAKYC